MIKHFLSACIVIGSLFGVVVGQAQTVTIRELNEMKQADFEKELSKIFNKAPWAISQASEKRPFIGFVDLYEKLIAELKNADQNKQLSAILGSADLACEKVWPKDMNPNSMKEHSSSGLNQCTADEEVLIKDLNSKYREKFGFPFMLAIKGYTKEEIMNEMKIRVNNDKKTELNNAMQQVYKVTMFRLIDKIK